MSDTTINAIVPDRSGSPDVLPLAGIETPKGIRQRVLAGSCKLTAALATLLGMPRDGGALLADRTVAGGPRVMNELRTQLQDAHARNQRPWPSPGDSAGVSRRSRRYGRHMAHFAARLTYVTAHSPGLSVVRAIVAASAVPLIVMAAVALGSLFITEAPEPRRNPTAVAEISEGDRRD